MKLDTAIIVLTLALATAARAQEPRPQAPADEPWSLDLTVHDVGIGIGNSKHIDGLRLNFRDVAPFTVHGVNATVWSPSDRGAGDVTGLALGIPVTGAGTLRGLGLGFGLAVSKEFDGVGVGILGLGSGGPLRGIFAGGLGVATSGDIDGLALGGLGVGCGGRLRGIVVAGLGVGCGEEVIGIAVGGLGVGAGGDLRGLSVAGLAVGAGGSIEGIAIAGLVGAPRIRGAVAALAAGGRDVAGLVVAPAYFDLMPDGSMTGVSVSAFNRIRGEQRGLAIGIVNYTPSLHGLQIGLVNWAGNNPSGLKLLPIVNAHID